MLRYAPEIQVPSFLNQVRYGLYVMTHPIDGFWDLKHANRGSFKSAMVLVFIFFLSTLVRRQLTEWYFNPANTLWVNIPAEIVSNLGPFALFVIASWCVTSLMDGEGTIVDISKTVAYSLVPLTLANFFATFMSHMLTSREAMMLDLIGNIGLIWTVGLIFLSTIVTHQYTVLRAVVVSMITLLGMLVMVILGLLVFFLIQQLVGFGMELSTELLIRINE